MSWLPRVAPVLLVLVTFLGSLLVTVAPAAAAEPSVSALGSDGDFYRLRSGAYGELFPAGKAAAEEAPVLVLEARLQQDGEETLERYLVAGTEGDELETELRLIYASRSDSLFILWRTSEPGDVQLVRLHDGEFSDIVTVREASVGEAGPLAVATTQDEALVLTEDGPVSVERTGIHLVWWQAGAAADGFDSAVYTPVIFLDGTYRGELPQIVLADLGDFGAGEPLTAAIPHMDGLAKAPSISAGIDSKSVVIGFADPASGRLVSLEARMIPAELGLVATAAESYVLDWDTGLGLGEIDHLSGGIRSHLIDIGVALHPGLRSYFAESAATGIADLAWSGGAPGTTLEILAGGIRSHLIDIGVRAFGTDGIERIFDSSRLSVVEVGAEQSAAGDFLRLYVVADRPVPEVGEGPAAIFLSPSADHSLVCWQAGEVLSYRESAEDGWSEVFTLSLGEGLDHAAAESVLKDRIRQR